MADDPKARIERYHLLRELRYPPQVCSNQDNERKFGRPWQLVETYDDLDAANAASLSLALVLKADASRTYTGKVKVAMERVFVKDLTLMDPDKASRVALGLRADS